MSEVKRARAICNMCPVMIECLEYAIVNREEFGVWGGSTARDRAKWWREHNVEIQAEDEPVDEEEILDVTEVA